MSTPRAHSGRDRPEAVRRIVEAEEPGATLLFARTRERVEELADALRDLGAEALHGGLTQPARDAVMSRFGAEREDRALPPGRSPSPQDRHG